MSTGPLRQYYDPVAATVPEVGCSAVRPGWRHRAPVARRACRADRCRMACAGPVCAAWDVQGVVSHLVTVDQYWVFAVGVGAHR